MHTVFHTRRKYVSKPRQRCIQCAVKNERRVIIDLTGAYRQFEICNDIKYYISEEEINVHKELTECLGCWSTEQCEEEQIALARIGKG